MTTAEGGGPPGQTNEDLAAPPPVDMRQAFLHGSVWTFLELWGARAANLLTFVLLGRLLQPDQFGLVALASASVSVLQILTDFGATSYLIRQPELGPHTRNSAFWSSAGLSAALYVALFLGAPVAAGLFGTPDLVAVLRVTGLVLLLCPFIGVQTALLTRALQFRSLTLRTLLATACASICGVGLALAGAGVWALVAQQLTYFTVSALVVFSASPWRPSMSADRVEVKRILRFGVSIVGIDLISQVGRQAPSLFIGGSLGPTALGYYSIASRLATTFVELFTNVFAKVAYPIFSRIQADRPRLARAYRRTVSLGTLLAAFALCALAALSPLLIPLLFGDKWSPSVRSAQLVAISSVFVAATYFDRPLRLAAGRQHLDLLVSSCEAVLVVTSLLCFAHDDLEAVLAALVVSQAVVWLISAYVCKHFLHVGGIALTASVLGAIAVAAVSNTAGVLVGSLVDVRPVVELLVAGCTSLTVWCLMVVGLFPGVRAEVQALVRRTGRRRRSARVEGGDARPTGGPETP